MVDPLVEVAGRVFEAFVGIFLHLTGECLLWLFTLGRRRIRWWDTDDADPAWPSTVLGIAFWMGVGALVWLALR